MSSWVCIKAVRNHLHSSCIQISWGSRLWNWGSEWIGVSDSFLFLAEKWVLIQFFHKWDVIRANLTCANHRFALLISIRFIEPDVGSRSLWNVSMREPSSPDRKILIRKTKMPLFRGVIGVPRQAKMNHVHRVYRNHIFTSSRFWTISKWVFRFFEFRLANMLIPLYHEIECSGFLSSGLREWGFHYIMKMSVQVFWVQASEKRDLQMTSNGLMNPWIQK